MKFLNCICLVLLVAVVACSAPLTPPEGISQLPTHTAQAADFPEPTAQPITTSVMKILDMLVPRAAHTSTLLPNGMVFIAGGFTSGENSLSSAEIFDPTSNKFSFTGSMNSARQSHTATLLPNGKVLIAGGYGHSGEYLRTAELYDPMTGKFTLIGEMSTPRAGQTAVLLNNGNVLLAGGVTTGWGFLDTAELYDPDKNTFASTGNMTVARESHTATLLKDGKVLITGGHQGRRSSITVYSSAEIYDPVSGFFALTSNMLTRRHKHDAVLLEDGRVLVAGGTDERDENGQYKSAEVYNPDTGQFSKISDMKANRYKFQGTSVLLKNGKVLIMGGADIFEIFDPTTNTFAEVIENVGAARLFAAATLLSDGRVVLSGGYGRNISSNANVWVFQP
jgi:hypothetical protein